MRVLSLFLAMLPCWSQENERLELKHEYFEYAGNEVVYVNVSIRLPGTFLMTADKAVSNQKTGIITASGNVKIDYYSSQGLVEVTAYEASYNQNTRLGSFTQVTAQFGEEFFFVGASLEIIEGGSRFVIQDGVITACNQASPQWSMRIKEATIEPEGYAVVHGARFRIKEVPVFYIPFFVAPAMQKRRTGLLTPDTGRSARNGLFFSQPIYWAPRQDMDFTITPAIYKDAGLRLGLEARYTPTATLNGIMRGSYFADDLLKGMQAQALPMEDGKPLDSDRFRATWQHEQDALRGFFRVDVEAGSDFSVDRDYLEEASRTRIRDYYYRVRFERPIGRNLLRFSVNRLERVLTTDETVQTVTSLPDLRFYQPTYNLGRGFYVRNYVYASHYNLGDVGPIQDGAQSTINPSVMRLGIDSEISRGQNWVRFLHTRWGARYQGAYYHMTSTEPQAIGTDAPETQTDQPQGQVLGGAYAFLESVGPRLQHIYRQGNKRLVHYIDLGLTMKLGNEEGDAFLEGIALDALDIRIGEQADGFRAAWRLNSRLFVGQAGKVRPLLDMEIRQDADFNLTNSQPIETRFRLLNLGGVHGHGIFEYDPDQRRWKTVSVYGSVNRGEWTGYGGYVKRRVSDTDNESFIGITQWKLPRWRSRFKMALDYDFGKREFKSQEFLYGYQGQCVGLYLSYLKSPFDSTRAGARDFFQIILNLRNLLELGNKF